MGVLYANIGTPTVPVWTPIPTGAPGLPGESWWSGAGAPSAATGNEGDWYLDTTNGDVWEKVDATTWTVKANIKGPQGIQGVRGPAVVALTYTHPGDLLVAGGVAELPVPFASTVVSVTARLALAPTGSSAIADVNKNGSTIFTTAANRPTFAIGSKASTTAMPDIVAFAAGDYVTVDIDQIGSTIPGNTMVLTVALREP